MTKFSEFTFPSKDGVHRCHASLWEPDGAPRAVVQIVHGVAEYAGRYDHFAQYLAGHGLVVCGEDHLGHGKTVDDGKYGYFGKRDGWTLVTADVRCPISCWATPWAPFWPGPTCAPIPAR